MNLTDNQIRDYKKLYIVKGDEGFSPERNKAIIDETIKDYEAKRKLKMKKFSEAIEERSEAVASYLTSSKVGTPVEKYFGKKTLARLRGEDIVNTLKTGLIIPRR